MQFNRRIVEAEFVEIVCDDCRQGVYRMNNQQPEHADRWTDSITIQCNPTVWGLKCHRCGQEITIAMPGPYLIYRGKKFILHDSVQDKIAALRSVMRKISDRRTAPKQ